MCGKVGLELATYGIQFYVFANLAGHPIESTKIYNLVCQETDWLSAEQNGQHGCI